MGMGFESVCLTFLRRHHLRNHVGLAFRTVYYSRKPTWNQRNICLKLIFTEDVISHAFWPAPAAG